MLALNTWAGLDREMTWDEGDANWTAIQDAVNGISVSGGSIANMFAQNGPADVLMIGDSNAAGVGQSDGYTKGFMGRVAQSLMNIFDKYPSANRGYMYFAWLNGYQMLAGEPGWSQGGGGSPVAGGPAGNAWRLPNGAWIERTGVQASQGRLYFAPSTDGSTIQVTVNGTIFQNITVNSDGMSIPFILAVGGAYIKSTDVVRFTCTSGSVDVYNARLMRNDGSYGPIVYCSPEGSQSFSDYTETNRSALLARYVNAYQPSAPKLVCCFLGTNNMIGNVGKQKSPAAMVADMQAFVTRYRSLMPGCAILFWVPPEPRSDVELPLATYPQYVKAMVDFVATQSMVDIVRMDLSGVRGPNVYADPDPGGATGVHLNSYGHAAAAKVICSYLGITTDISYPGFAAGT